ncbi:nitroreductase family protein, partial [Chloroflexota bacterium]
MMTLMETIEKRRSIRSFKPDPVPEETLNHMLEAARLAPSGSNRQPWRFQLITDQALKKRIFDEGSFGAGHILEAPLIIVCGSELLTYVKGHQLAPAGSEYFGAENEDMESLKSFITDAQINTAIAVEHMVLAATDSGIGTCWMQRIKPGQIAKILGWPRNIVVFALLLVGYPNEEPVPRPRL